MPPWCMYSSPERSNQDIHILVHGCLFPFFFTCLNLYSRVTYFSWAPAGGACPVLLWPLWITFVSWDQHILQWNRPSHHDNHNMNIPGRNNEEEKEEAEEEQSCRRQPDPHNRDSWRREDLNCIPESDPNSMWNTRVSGSCHLTDGSDRAWTCAEYKSTPLVA